MEGGFGGRQADMGRQGEVLERGELAEPVFWTFDLVRDALAETISLWARSPGGGVSPFATDGPWKLMVRDIMAGDYDARGGDGTSSDVALRPLPLTRDQVARRDAQSEWLSFIDKPEDRRLVVAAVAYLAKGHARVPWRRIKHRLGIPFGEHGLRKRFERAISAICQALNGAEIRR